MKILLATALVLATLGGTVAANAATLHIGVGVHSMHHRPIHHRHRVCEFRHHHRVCFWR